MWHNFNNNEEYYREYRERESKQWENQTSMESFNQQNTISMLQQILDIQTSQNDEMEEWDREYHYMPTNEEMGYVEEYGHQQESFDPYLHYQDASVENHREEEDLNLVLLQKILDGQDRMEERFAEMDSNVNGAYNELSARLCTLADQYKVLEDQVSKAEGEIEEVSNEEDTVQQSRVCDVFPEEYDVVDQRQEYCTHMQCLYEDEEEIGQLHEDVLSEDVQDALFPIEEEIEEIPKVEDAMAEEEVEEIIQLHEDSLDIDALASIVAVTNQETLRYNKASTEYAKDKEEEEVVQLFELSRKELHQDEAVEPRVPGTPTPRFQHPQGPRKRCEWKIKHKWRIKPRNV